MTQNCMVGGCTAEGSSVAKGLVELTPDPGLYGNRNTKTELIECEIFLCGHHAKVLLAPALMAGFSFGTPREA